ncbi:MAG: toxin-antitoxin system, antitoxin component, Xre family protein [Methylococcaceae bacterium]
MSVPIQQIEQVAHKLQTLSQERITEVEDFIDFLKQRDESSQLTRNAMKLTEPLLSNLWNNTEDAEYDQL